MFVDRTKCNEIIAGAPYALPLLWPCVYVWHVMNVLQCNMADKT